jgi:hypothetical protein
MKSPDMEDIIGKFSNSHILLELVKKRPDGNMYVMCCRVKESSSEYLKSGEMMVHEYIAKIKKDRLTRLAEGTNVPLNITTTTVETGTSVKLDPSVTTDQSVVTDSPIEALPISTTPVESPKNNLKNLLIDAKLDDPTPITKVSPRNNIAQDDPNNQITQDTLVVKREQEEELLAVEAFEKELLNIQYSKKLMPQGVSTTYGTLPVIKPKEPVSHNIPEIKLEISPSQLSELDKLLNGL